jgi:hypothetical protein
MFGVYQHSDPRRTRDSALFSSASRTRQDILAEGQEVEVQVKIVQTPKPPISEGLAKIYAILGERYHSGHTDTAERHNEHQP